MTLTSLPDSERQHPTPAFDMVVFGGTGDLAMRKLMPSLMHRDIDGAERMVEKLAELPLIGDQVVCLSHEPDARSGTRSRSWQCIC